jgi:hypothetical protein
MDTCPFGIEELNDVRFWVDQYTFYSRHLNKYVVKFSLVDRQKEKYVSDVFVPMSKLMDNSAEELKIVIDKLHQDRDSYLKNDNT